jgi:hypothetical protein
MNKILDSLDSFTMWMIEHPSTTDCNWEAKFPIWLVDNSCVFSHGEAKHSNDTIYTADAHKNCALSVGLVIETGGASGGSCWGDEAEEYTTSETLPDINVLLTEIVNYFIDNISHRDYLDIARVIKYDYPGKGEYYGNYTSRASVYMNLVDLYKALISKANV